MSVIGNTAKPMLHFHQNDQNLVSFMMQVSCEFKMFFFIRSRFKLTTCRQLFSHHFPIGIRPFVPYSKVDNLAGILNRHILRFHFVWCVPPTIANSIGLMIEFRVLPFQRLWLPIRSISSLYTWVKVKHHPCITCVTWTYIIHMLWYG